MKFPKRVYICEVGPRDGLQNEKQRLTIEQKAELIELAAEAGLKQIEIGSFVHPKAIPALADTDEMYARLHKRDDVEYRALITNLKGVERAAAAGVKKVKLTVSVSTSHNLSNFNRTPEETVRSFRECVAVARSQGMEVSGAMSTAFGCPFEGKIEIPKIESIVKELTALGITELSLSDTTGMANPKEVYEKCSYFTQKYPDVQWNLHLHNTRDMAMACIITAMQAGIVNFDGSFAGLGGCPYAPGASGNACTEDIVHMLHEMGIETGIDLDKLIALSKKVREYVGHDTESYMLKAGKCSDLIKEKVTGQKKM